MADQAARAVSRNRRRWSEAEKHRIVSLTLSPMASVSEVARAYGVNANQLFKWRRAFESQQASGPTALLPVTVSSEIVPSKAFPESAPERCSSEGGISIELPDHAMVWVERKADPGLVRLVLECLRK
jgi:transposase